MSSFCKTLDYNVKAIALNKDASQIVVAGNTIIKIFSIGKNDLIERGNIYLGSKSSKSLYDVVWNDLNENILASSTENKVVIWNLTYCKPDYEYKSHERVVNKVSFHPVEENYLLSCSMDCRMILYDIRIKSVAAVFVSPSATSGIRDIQFNPHDPNTFAACLDSGGIELWDIRKSDQCEQFSAHGQPVYSVDWHPERNWLATASRDEKIKIWDMDDTPHDLFPLKTIPTSMTTSRARWRPHPEFPDHIASCSEVYQDNIYLWDIKRPSIPFMLFKGHKNGTTGILWKDSSSMFSFNKNNPELYHHSVDDKDNIWPTKKIKPVGLSVSTHGDIVQFRTTEVYDDQPSTSMLKLINFNKRSSLCSSHIVESAKHYKLHGKSLKEVCEHNASVAVSLCRPHVSITWKILHLLYLSRGTCEHGQCGFLKESVKFKLDSNHDHDESQRAENDIESDGSKLTNIIRARHTDQDMFFGDSEDVHELDQDYSCHTFPDLNRDLSFHEEAFYPRILVPNSSVSPKQFNEVTSQDIEVIDSSLSSWSENTTEPLLVHEITNLTPTSWDYERHVKDMLQSYANCGDVQMAVTCYIVLGERTKNMFDETEVVHWFLAYIELLQRLQLLNIANIIINYAEKFSLKGDEESLLVVQQSAHFSIKCLRCDSDLQPMKSLCHKCSPQVTCPVCVICRGAVRGLYVWCQGCAHGGHLNHIAEWISRNADCPAGCGHYCEYS